MLDVSPPAEGVVCPRKACPMDDARPERGSDKLEQLLAVERRLDAMVEERRREAERIVEEAREEADRTRTRHEAELREGADRMRIEIEAEADRAVTEIRDERARDARRYRAVDEVTIDALGDEIVRRLVEPGQGASP